MTDPRHRVYDDEEGEDEDRAVDRLSGWFWVGVGFAMLVTLASALTLGTNAWGHSWYTGMVNPVTGALCCGTEDCKPFPSERVKVVAGGYLVSPEGREPELVPYPEVLTSADQDYHRCAFLSGPHAGKRRCFIAPPQGF